MVPAAVVLIFPDVTALSGLYAIGVVGAIAINLGTTSTNPELALKAWERAGWLSSENQRLVLHRPFEIKRIADDPTE